MKTRLIALLAPLLLASCATLGVDREEREANRVVRQLVRQGSAGLWFTTYTNGAMPPAGPAVVVTSRGPIGPFAGIEFGKGPGPCQQWDSGCRSMEATAKAAAKRAKRQAAKDQGCDLFVLDLTHDPLAGPAIDEYERQADAYGYYQLAEDLRLKRARRKAKF